MMRRSSVLAISTFGFGQPDLSTEFGSLQNAVVPKGEAKPQVTTLPNGVRVISHDRDGAQASVGFYLRAGPKYDPSNKPGLSMVMRFALTNSNMDNSLFQISRTKQGAGVSHGHHEINKEWIAFRHEGRRDAWQKPFEDLASCVAIPRFAEWDTEKFRDTMDNLLQEKRWTQPREFVKDAVEQYAFWKQPLGSPRHVPVWANDQCNHKALVEQWSNLVVPKNVVLAAVNVNHEELVAAYQNAPFSHSADAPHHRDAQTLVPTLSEFNQYSAREHHEFEDRGKAKHHTGQGIEDSIISALVYPVKSGTSSATNYGNVLVLNELLAMAAGESVQLASGDATTEAHARGLQSFGREFHEVSLLGVTTQSNPADATNDIVEANKILTKGVSITPENVKVAQVRAATRFYHDHIEYQRDYVDFLGSSFVSNAALNTSTEDVLKAIDATSVTSLTPLHKAAVETHKPTFYATGNTVALPSLRQMGI